MDVSDLPPPDFEAECVCLDTGWIGREWLYRRDPECSCKAATNNFTTVLHDVSCDCVPCPFCPLEAIL